MLQVLTKEFNAFLNSLIAYVATAVFLTVVGLLMWVFPETSILEFGYADMSPLFSFGPYVLMFLIPAITMRSFAEERKSGTMEMLFTKPLTDWQIIGGKFLASFILVGLAILPTVIYYFSIRSLGSPPANLDTPGIIGSYIGLVLLGAVFCAIGVMSSALTSNQIVSFIVAAFLSFLLFSGFDSLSVLSAWSEFSLTIRQFGLLYHYESLSRGLVDSRDIIYFVSIALLMLLITRIILGARSW
jgi:ABC-2 type transport system permease protein